MSTAGPAYIYTGPWVDWSQGAILGSTITLSSTKSQIFTAFLAFFITIVAACLWRILCFLIHQFSASEKPKDGMHHQHQLIFRNAPSPTGATRAFFESAFFWRKSSRHSFARAIPLAFFAITFTLAMSAGSILSSLVARNAGSHRLIVSPNCGYFEYNNASSLPIRTKAQISKDLNDTMIAAFYARQCYEGNDRLNKLQCSSYNRPALTYKALTNASCPFESSMCQDDLVYQLDTGLLDSHNDLGINFPAAGRISFRKVATCAPLTQQGFLTNTTSTGTDGLGIQGDNVLQYNYGGISQLLNTTYFYNTHTLADGFGYTLESISALPNATAGWLPDPAIAQPAADLSLIFLASNGIQYYTANNDPLFSANVALDAGSTATIDASYYLADNIVSVLGCTDQYQYCHPSNPSRCTPLSDYLTASLSAYTDDLGLNDLQQALATRIALLSRSLSIHHAISGRGAAALRANDLVSERSQLEIQKDQWHVEINGWFDIALAKLQRGMVEYAAGPDFLPEGTRIRRPEEMPNGGVLSKAMCGSQMVRTADGTTSFSVLGISIIFGVGGFIVLVYLVLETVVAFAQRTLKWGDYRRVRWVMDDKLQVQRMAFEGAGMGGEWRNLSGLVPVTSGGQVFAGLNGVDPENPRWVSGGVAMGKMDHHGRGGSAGSSVVGVGVETKYDGAGVQQPQQQNQQYGAQMYEGHGYGQQQQQQQQQMQGEMRPMGYEGEAQQWPIVQQAQQVAYERPSYQPVPVQGQ